MPNQHHSHDADVVALAVLTVTSSRTAQTDASGDAIVDELPDGDVTVTHRTLVDDDERMIRTEVESAGARDDVDAVVTTGGTGLTPDDVTPEAVRPLFEREIPGFGERFRSLSVDAVGAHGMLTRATAGISDGVPIFCLPGSENAARLGASELIAPTVHHILGLVRGQGTHGHDHADHGDDEGGQ
jgi:molybdenum cofactor biosynthesis protein B